MIGPSTRKPHPAYNPKVWKFYYEGVLTRAIGGQSADEIAAHYKKSPKTIELLLASDLFQQRMAELVQASRARMLSGESGPLAIAEAAAEEAMQTLVDLMRSSDNDHVRRQCAVDILAHAGLQPAARTEVRVTIQHLVEQMTSDELQTFTTTQQWPARLEGEARRLLAANAR